MKWLLGLTGFSPYMILAVIAVGTGLFFFGRYAGGHAQRLEDAAAALKTVTVEIAAVHQEEIKLNLISTSVEFRLEEVRLVTLTINKQVDAIVADPLYARACFDPAGLSLANHALSATPADPGQPRPALSITVPAGGRDGRVGAP